jgi:hypothetical protein
MSTWESATFYSEDTVERRRSAKVVAFAFGVAAMVAVRAAPSHLTALVFVATLASILAVALRANPWPRLVRVRTHASRHGLFISGRAIPRPLIESAVLVPSEGEGTPYVRVVARGMLPIEIGVATPDDGRTFLHALGFDVSQCASEFSATSLGGVLVTTWCLVPLLALPVLFDRAVTPFAIASVVALVLAAALFPTKVSVATDGVSIRRFGRARFISSSDIEWVETARGAILQLRSGEKVRVPIGTNGMGQRDGSKEIAAFVERVEQAIAAHRVSASEPSPGSLERAGRSAAAWMDALRRVGAGANATMRTAPASPEQLVRVVESPASRPIDRAAAAVALQTSEDVVAKARVRSVASAVANATLREALEAAADEDEARTAAALEALATRR